jgi:predicted aconitase
MERTAGGKKLVRLSDDEQRMLDGGQGRLKQVAMENVVRYATVLGAGELCEVTKATVFCGAHRYLEVCTCEDFHEVFSKMNMATDEIVHFDATAAGCHVQSCVSPCDQYRYASLSQTEQFFQKNSRYLAEAGKAGVIIAGTCAPYLTGWLPVKGEHFVTTESGVTVIGNSIWGAMGNADGIEAAFWSAICGRTPRWGNHLPEQRRGTHVVRVRTRLGTTLDWDLLGMAVGSRMPAGGVPVVDGGFSRAGFNDLRQFCTSLAITSNCELCHIVGITPEARSVEDALHLQPARDQLSVTDQELAAAYDTVCDQGEGEISLVSLGCPHYDIDQIKRVAMALDGKKISPQVHFMVWTVYPIKCMADENGYTRIIEEAGGQIYTSTCPTTIGPSLLDSHPAMVFDSLKQAVSVRSCVSARVHVGDALCCIEAAVRGRWTEEMRWKQS